MKQILLGLTISLTLTVAHKQTIAQGAWTQKANFGGVARYGSVGFSIGTKGYMGTGAYPTNPTFTNDFWEFNPTTNAWTQKANFGGTVRSGGLGFSIGTKGYIGLGEYWSTYYRDFWEYDPSTNSWTQKANFGGSARTGAVGFSIGNYGYIGTGQDTTGNVKDDFWQYDPSTDTWTQKTNFSGNARYHAVGFSIGTKGYIGTGGIIPNNTGGNTDDFWEWDQATNLWAQKANYGGGITYAATGFSIANKGYIGTGNQSGGPPFNDLFWEYDPTANLWIQKTNFSNSSNSKPRTSATGFSIGLKGYIGTGYANGPWNDFWEFDTTSVGINELDIKISVSAFPNPFSFSTTLQTDKVFKNASLTIYNSYGQRVKQIDNLSGQTIIFHRDNLPSGLYFLCLTKDNKIITADKLIITDN